MFEINDFDRGDECISRAKDMDRMCVHSLTDGMKLN